LQEGYDAVTAENLDEAEDWAKNLLPDVFLADMNMLLRRSQGVLC
jgi:DNA-binding response OmpR family regulator